MRGMLVNIYRTAGGDCTNGGVSATADKALVVGPGIPEIFAANELPVLVLAPGLGGFKTARLVPLVLQQAKRWTMFGGNFAYTSDSRFAEAVRAIAGGSFCGAVPIHDRVEG